MYMYCMYLVVLVTSCQLVELTAAVMEGEELEEVAMVTAVFVDEDIVVATAEVEAPVVATTRP